MLDDAIVQNLRRHFEEGWNSGDVDTIMAPFAGNVVFNSPFVSRITGDRSKTTIEGSAALRSYVEKSLQPSRGVRYHVDATFASTDAVVLVYTIRLPDGSSHTGADTMRIDAGGRVFEWRSHYSFRSEEVEHLLEEP